ncbi:LysR family transcriptional regulator [Paraburkholderia sp. BL25I1N1]|uniref:LysR family transcriptional regulator n=1 Tax=Paraburkholderia sp. BL25I1N1 TaxID=1938804 RepID=UPI000D052604|nr:LysR family transcriptional regulator [Paraburkholderia sp. BL25I1N1]PRX92101.1 DNA-binding transcriptional LysR family regulator [Paraburkholderia sp. BL25I1N1]
MDEARSGGVDLAHLKMFLELFRQRSVSRTAEALDTTQPRISIALGKLRRHYGDPLFVRSGQTMQPTVRAVELSKPLLEAVRLIEQSRERATVFSAKDARRKFRIALADAGTLVMLPPIIDFLHRHSPHMTLDVCPLSLETPERIESGDIDLAIGFMGLGKRGLYRQALFKDIFVCLLRADHPLSETGITTSAYAASQHIIVDGNGSSLALLRRVFSKANFSANLAVVMPSYFGIPEMLASTDLVATVPERLAVVLLKSHPLKILPVPLPTPTISVSQHWHPRSQHDCAHAWLRKTVLEVSRKDCMREATPEIRTDR